MPLFLKAIGLAFESLALDVAAGELRMISGKNPQPDARDAHTQTKLETCDVATTCYIKTHHEEPCILPKACTMSQAEVAIARPPADAADTAKVLAAFKTSSKPAMIGNWLVNYHQDEVSELSCAQSNDTWPTDGSDINDKRAKKTRREDRARHRLKERPAVALASSECTPHASHHSHRREHPSSDARR